MESSCSFERDMNHNYLIITQPCYFDIPESVEDYRIRMIMENQISGLLRMEKRKMCGYDKYYYDINQMQSLESMYENREMTGEELIRLLSGCVRLFQRLEEYLLEGEQIVLEPAYIYIHQITGEPYFLYDPAYAKNEKKNFVLLTDYLLTIIDHTQEKTVMLGYQIYRYTRNPNFIMQQIEEMINKQQMEDCISEYQIARSFEKEHNVEPVYEQQEDIAQVLYHAEPKQVYDELYGKQREEIHHKKLGILLNASFVCAGLLLGILNQCMDLFAFLDAYRIYILGEIMVSFTGAILFLISLKKTMEKEKETTEDTKTLEEETIVLSKAHQLEGIVNGDKKILPLLQFPLTIGKAADYADLVIHDQTVSRVHARLEEKQGRVYLLDLHSTNGTKRNGMLLAAEQAVELLSGDEISFGGTSFVYV